ncbi:hypothetical protein WICPIJ_009686 [Wickerhamomyces pijperi]|uniref:Uncharacterized protein n=1 Tax=Wickerhamomyces pijperi TaxID=599730 RepID=A0A9P8PLR5_WICPI|nr:hypothetical protein WICPIJ_009686 [Wickerhamomyces pijperi]
MPSVLSRVKIKSSLVDFEGGFNWYVSLIRCEEVSKGCNESLDLAEPINTTLSSLVNSFHFTRNHSINWRCWEESPCSDSLGNRDSMDSISIKVGECQMAEVNSCVNPAGDCVMSLWTLMTFPCAPWPWDLDSLDLEILVSFNKVPIWSKHDSEEANKGDSLTSLMEMEEVGSGTILATILFANGNGSSDGDSCELLEGEEVKEGEGTKETKT